MRTSKKKSFPVLPSKGEKKKHPPAPLRPSLRSARKKDKRRKIELSEYSKLNKKLIDELDTLLQFAPPDRLSRNLRNMFLLFLSYEKDGIPSSLDDMVIDFFFLLEFLDKSAEELREAG